ncbi:winged helix-turn-helix domain-containing protein [Micromonospora pattaloongensis]|uniref:winged helix-turn-helix domain-containing protein n=1 Tax=Micromonospora pattaloongensis TaxID=405436 RepID=UPI000B87F205
MGGDGAVAARHRGTLGGEPVPLGREQELDLIDVLRGRWPEEFGLGDPLWTRRSLAALVEHRYGLALSSADAGRYLRAWGVWEREPTDRACALCADAVSRWMETDYPAIARSARQHGGEVFWVGRTRLHGVTPAADVLSAVSNRGRMRFMIITPAVDPPLPRDFLLRLPGPNGRTTHVVVDGSWARRDWPRRVSAQIVLHPLPSCERAG